MAQWQFSIPIPRFLAKLLPESAIVAPETAVPPASPPAVTDVRMLSPIYAAPEAIVRRKSAAAATRIMSETTFAPEELTLDLGGDAPLGIEQQIRAGLDRSALVFLKILENEERDPETKALIIDSKTRAEHFRMLVDWLVKRQKSGGADEAVPPYELIGRYLRENNLKIVPAQAGRPTNATKAAIEAVMTADKPAKPDRASKPEPEEPSREDGALQERLRQLRSKAPIAEKV